MERIYKVELVTPLVMAGIDKYKPEIRTQSIKGILRWWYRFWKAPEVSSIEELRKNENEIFGSTDRASRVRIAISEEHQGPWGAVLKLKERGDCYLCMNDKRREGEDGARKNYKKIYRQGFTEGSFFLKIEAPDESVLREVEKTLGYLSSFGGLGARWRRGFGSVRVYRVYRDTGELLKVEPSRQSLKDERLKAFPNLGSVRIWKVEPKGKTWSKWEDAMNELRDELYRAFKRKVGQWYLGNPSGRRFASPLIISIKSRASNYYGVIILHEVSGFWRLTRMRVKPEGVAKELSSVIRQNFKEVV